MDNKNIVSLKVHKTETFSIVASSLVFFVFAFFLWKQQEIDFAIVLMQNNVFENDILLNFFILVSRFGMGFISLIYGLLILLSLKNDEMELNRPLFLYIIFVFAFGSISGDLLNLLFERARPVVQLAGQISNSMLSDTFSFPSGHATKSMSLALPFILVASNRNAMNKIVKILLLFASTLVCYSRIALQRHFPSDVLAGIAVALLAVVIGHWIVNFFYKQRSIDNDKLQSLSFRLCFVFIALAILLTII